MKKAQVAGQIGFEDMLDNQEAQKLRPTVSTDWKWRYADYPQQKNGLTVFSCFACGGGSTMGYKLAGCDVLGCCEIDPKMNKMYRTNHNPKYNYLMDIREFNKLPDDTLPRELFNLDILDGSPPCTTFSMAGKREEGWGKKKKFREGQAEQTLDDLSFVFIETVKKLKPRVVIMENVEGLLLGNAWSYVQKIYRNFLDIGYQVKHFLLKGENMGVPQTRHRVFFIALRINARFDIDSLDMSFNYAPVTYAQIKNGEMRPLIDGSLYKNIARQSVPQDKCIADTRVRLGQKGSAFQTFYIRDNEIMPTVRTKPDVIDIENLAWVSKETIISAQTFPQDYIFDPPSAANVGYVCGMSVPPVMIKRVVQRLIESGVFEY